MNRTALAKTGYITAAAIAVTLTIHTLTPEPNWINQIEQTLNPTQHTIHHLHHNNRTALLITPLNHPPDKPIPLLINIHGYGSDPAEQNTRSGHWQHLGKPNYQFAMLLPEGNKNPEGLKYWNAADYCCDFHNTQPDDITHIKQLIQQTSQHITIQHIWATGTSNGGILSYKLACETDLIHAVVSMGGLFYHQPNCPNQTGTNLLHIHGTEDTTILYHGNTTPPEYPSVQETTQIWVTKLGCRPNPTHLEPLNLVPTAEGKETHRTIHTTNCPKPQKVETWKVNNQPHIPAYNPRTYSHHVLTWLQNLQPTKKRAPRNEPGHPLTRPLTTQLT